MLVGISCLMGPCVLDAPSRLDKPGSPREEPPWTSALCALLLGDTPPRSPVRVSRDTRGYLGLWAALTGEPTLGSL